VCVCFPQCTKGCMCTFVPAYLCVSVCKLSANDMRQNQIIKMCMCIMCLLAYCIGRPSHKHSHRSTFTQKLHIYSTYSHTRAHAQLSLRRIISYCPSMFQKQHESRSVKEITQTHRDIIYFIFVSRRSSSFLQ